MEKWNEFKLNEEIKSGKRKMYAVIHDHGAIVQILCNSKIHANKLIVEWFDHVGCIVD